MDHKAKFLYKNNGMISRVREIVYDALVRMGKEGATIDELVTLVGDDIGGITPKMGIGKVIRVLQDFDVVVEYRGRWYTKENAPEKAQTHPRLNGNTSAPVPAKRVEVAAYMGKRPEKTVSVYTAPETHTNVIGITFTFRDDQNRVAQWKLPLFVNTRICIVGVGQDTPILSPQQEMYYRIENVRLLLKGGTYVDKATNLNDVIVIAPDE